MSYDNVDSIQNIRKKMTHTHESISTAIHEAGHTVYGLLHHMKVSMVHIFEDKKTKRICGLTHFAYPISDEAEDPELAAAVLKSEICINYAGLVAEKHHFKIVSGSDKFPRFLKNCSSSDITSAATIIKQRNLVPPGKKRYEFKNKLIKETYQELKVHWGAVTVISHALFKKKKLNFKDLKKILTDKSFEDRDFWKQQFKDIEYIFQKYGDLDESSLKTLMLHD